jgi:hypothetical protein
MRVAALVTLTCLGIASTRASAETSRTVPCDELILHVKFPYGDHYRLLLDVISVPPAFLAQIVPSGKKPWRYWRKAGLIVTGSEPVSVSVPQAWRGRAAITWGNRPGVFSSLRIAGCPPEQDVAKGRAYAGGFYLKSRSACVPLTFRVGERITTVRFGLGKRCK